MKFWTLFRNREVPHEEFKPTDESRECGDARPTARILPYRNPGNAAQLDSARRAKGEEILKRLPPLSPEDLTIAMLTFSAQINAETVRNQQQDIARLQGLLAEIIAEDKECGYLNATLSHKIQEALRNV